MRSVTLQTVNRQQPSPRRLRWIRIGAVACSALAGVAFIGLGVLWLSGLDGLHAQAGQLGSEFVVLGAMLLTVVATPRFPIVAIIQGVMLLGGALALWAAVALRSR